jgi:hypothetical protein
MSPPENPLVSVDLLEETFIIESRSVAPERNLVQSVLDFQCTSTGEIHQKMATIASSDFQSPPSSLADLESCILTTPFDQSKSSSSEWADVVELPISLDILHQSFTFPENLMTTKYTSASVQAQPTKALPVSETLSLEPVPGHPSRLFPKAASLNTPKVGPSDPRPAIVVDQTLIQDLDFQAAFSDCHVIVRKIRAADIELNDRCAVLVRDFVPARVAAAMVSYERVFLVSTSPKACLAFLGSHSLSVRVCQDNSQVMGFIRSMATPEPNTYLRDAESLHEMLLCLFPTISRSLSHRILKKGNPITDPGFCFEEFSPMNIHPFNVLLDTPTLGFQKSQIGKKKVVKQKKGMESESILSFIHGDARIRAPRPGSIKV